MSRKDRPESHDSTSPLTCWPHRRERRWRPHCGVPRARSVGLKTINAIYSAPLPHQCTYSTWTLCPQVHGAKGGVRPSWNVIAIDCIRERDWAIATSAMETTKWSQLSRHLFTIQMPPCWSQMTSVSSDWSKPISQHFFSNYSRQSGASWLEGHNLHHLKAG